MAAAVADYTPASASRDQKVPKADGPLTLTLQRTKDILADLGSMRVGARRRAGPVLVGFAAETDDVVAQGAREARAQEGRSDRRQRRVAAGSRLRRRHQCRDDRRRRRRRAGAAPEQGPGRGSHPRPRRAAARGSRAGKPAPRAELRVAPISSAPISSSSASSVSTASAASPSGASAPNAELDSSTRTTCRTREPLEPAEPHASNPSAPS